MFNNIFSRLSTPIFTHHEAVEPKPPTSPLHHYLHALHTLKLLPMAGHTLLATIYLQLIQNRYLFRSFTVLRCSHQHCVQPVASDVEVVGYL